ncbi:hypothetical protein ACQJBY_051841 [Aegilops geniculata]
MIKRGLNHVIVPHLCVILGSLLHSPLLRYRQILLAIIISSYFKLFLLTMMVWEFPSSAIFIVEAFVLSSNVVALRVVTRFPKAHCVGVCFMAHAAKHLTERWLMWTP